jgi:hypothetical protein
MRQMDKKIKEEEQESKPSKVVIKKEEKVIKETSMDLSDDLAGTINIHIIIFNSRNNHYY